MDHTTQSSVSAHMRRFVEEAAVPSESEMTSASAPSESTAPTSTKNDKYKNRLRYRPNAEFSGDNSMAASIPNTFKHKSHPNAKTKDHIGMPLVVESKPESPPYTSTMKGLNSENHRNESGELSGELHTPSWMPAELRNEDLAAENPSVHQQPANLDFLPSRSNTFIHNQPDSKAPATPMWKRISQEYQHAKRENLQSIFQNSHSGLHSSSHLASKDHNSYSSALSTPVATKDADIHLTQQQIHQLEDILEKAKDKPDDYQIQGSPLKLFGNEYDTFTKAFLSRFVDKVRSNANSAQKVPDPHPKIRMKSFPKAGDYSNQDFLDNANSIFAQIQKKGPAFNHILNEENSPSFQPSLEHNTVTSTPKAEKTRDLNTIASVDEYSSFSTDFDQNSSAESHHPSQETHQNDYTSIDKTYMSRGVRNETEQNGSSYTFDEDEESTQQMAENDIFQDSMSSVKRHEKPAKKDPQIHWKRPSQLRLVYESVKPMSANSANQIRPSKGTVKPGSFELPKQYGDMVFDSIRQKWVSTNKENDLDGLNFIEDLHVSSVEKPEKKKNRSEVSFQLPDQSFNTGVSEIENSFTQIHKRLVSSITDASETASWDSVTFIDLSDSQLESVEGLSKYLPNLKNADLSRNSIKFLGGLPVGIMELNVAENTISDLASFKQFHDLQSLNVAGNSLSSVSGLSTNMHLTKLDLSNNNISSIDGLAGLSALTHLNLSQNSLTELDLAKLGLHSLQELDVSENKLSVLKDLQEVPELRILNANENVLTEISSDQHTHLKKLLLKFNKFKKLHLLCFPFLRVLRIDGNDLEEITDLGKLKYLQEVSAKCQSNSLIAKGLFESGLDMVKMDFSGNSIISQIRLQDQFLNLNELNLSAVGLSEFGDEMGEMFANVRDLNLNFNRLSDLRGLQKLRKLRKIHLLSNNVDSMEVLLTSLCNARKSLRVLDLRLNSVNVDFYPYVFNPLELTAATENSSPIQLEASDDIENFSIHYNSMLRSKEEWTARDQGFLDQMHKEGNSNRLKERLNYQALLVTFLPYLRELDGGIVDSQTRKKAESCMQAGHV